MARGYFDLRFLGISIELETCDDNLEPEYDAFFRVMAQGRINNLTDIYNSGSMRSVPAILAHELRHFHDALLSPYAAHLMMRRYSAGLQGEQLLLLTPPGSLLGVPFGRWARLSMEERRTLREQLTEHGLRPDQPSYEPDADSQKVLARMESYYRQLSSLTATGSEHGIEGLDQVLQPVDSLEASACAAQLAQCFHASATAAQKAARNARKRGDFRPRNRDLLLAGDAGLKLGAEYRRIFEYFAVSRASGERYTDVRFASLVALWSLLGDDEVDKQLGFPPNRVLLLVNWALNNDVTTAISRGADLLNEWSDHFGVLPWKVVLERNIARVERFLRSLSTMNSLAEPTLRVIAQYFEAAREMASIVRKDIWGYADPRQYVLSIQSLPAAPVRLKVPDDFELTIGEENALWTSAHVLADGRRVVHEAILRHPICGRIHLDVEDVHHAFTANCIADFLFRETDRADRELSLGRTVVASRDIVAFEVPT